MRVSLFFINFFPPVTKNISILLMGHSIVTGPSSVHRGGQEMHARLDGAAAAFGAASTFLCDRRLPVKDRIRMFSVHVVSKLLVGVAFWNLNSRHVATLGLCYRACAGYIWKEGLTNHDCRSSKRPSSRITTTDVHREAHPVTPERPTHVASFFPHGYAARDQQGDQKLALRLASSRT